MPTAYLAADGFEAQLDEELGRAGVPVSHRHGRLLISEAPAAAAAWAANIWHDCVDLPVPSIGEAAKALRALQRNWAMYAPLHHRRAALIQERLPHVSSKPVVFPAAAPTAPLGKILVGQGAVAPALVDAALQRQQQVKGLWRKMAHSAAAQQLLQRPSFGCEEASEKLPLGRQARARAVAAEGLRHRGDDADFARAILVSPALGDFAGVIRISGFQRHFAADGVDNLACGDDIIHAPAVGVADIHEFDKPQYVSLLLEIARHRHDAVFVDAALDDHVDLDW